MGKNKQMDWEDLHHFSAFVVAGSLLGAARSLSVEHATVSRRIAALEAELGLKLVDRRGRRLTLTPAGERVAAIAQRMTEETDAIARLARGAQSELSGEVIISAPSAYAAAVLAEPLATLQSRHPGLYIRLLGEARTASLERREADIAIRLSRPETGDLTAVKLGEMSFRLYAEANYAGRRAEHEWRFIGNDGLLAHAPQQAALAQVLSDRAITLASDHVEIQLALVRAGGGVAMLPDFMAADAADLIAVQPEDAPLVRDIWLVVHTDMQASASVRAVIDTLRGG